MRTRACGLIRRDGKVLLQRKRTDVVWALPGGGVEHGETADAALRREFLEELGWDVRVGSLVQKLENRFVLEGEDVLQAELYYEVFCASPLGKPREEILEFRWLSQHDMRQADVRPIAIREILFS